MININCQGKLFTIDNNTINKIPVIKKMIDNKDNFCVTKNNQLFLQLDPFYFQLLVNFVTIPNFIIPPKHKTNFINVSNMYLLKQPWLNNHCSTILTNTNIIKYENIYHINDIFVTLLSNSFESINFKNGYSQKNNLISYPNITHTKILVNDQQMFNNSKTHDLQPNVCIWNEQKQMDDSRYDSNGIGIINRGAFYGYYRLNHIYLNVINEKISLTPINSLSLVFDDFQKNHIAYCFVEINYDTL